MIQDVSVTPVYNNGEDMEVKKLTGFGIFVDCDMPEADKILNLIKNMLYSRYFGEKKNDD